MVTQAKNGISKPKVYAATVSDSLEPKLVKATLSIPHWKQDMDDEYAALIRNNTWSLVNLPSGRVAIGSK